MPTIKVTEEEYNRIVEARRQLALQGLNRLSTQINQRETTDLEKFTLGAIVGIGALLLLNELNREN